MGGAGGSIAVIVDGVVMSGGKLERLQFRQTQGGNDALVALAALGAPM